MKSVTLRSAITAIICSLSYAAAAYADPQAVDVPAGDLIVALESLAKQSGVEFVYQSSQLKGLRTEGIKGAYAPKDAISLLLKGTPLTVRTDETGAIMIAPPRVERPAKTTSALTDGAEAFRGSQEQRIDPDGRVRVAQVDRKSSAASPSIGQSDILTGNDSTRIELEEIVVTGTHIRGSEPAGSKVIVIDREEIDKSGYGQLKDFMEILPQNFTGISEDFNQSSVANQNFGTEIQLRGLGPGTTLTLVNGHRVASGGSLGAFTDISSIPASAIERVEILPDGASALYGSDAIGGVVNIILRKDFEGAETRARFGSSGGDANERQLAQLFGHNWSSGSVLLGYQYTQRDRLTYDERAYTATGDLRPFGGADRRRDNTFRRGGTPGNIIDAAGQVAYAIPDDQDGTALTVAQLLPGATNYQDVSYGTVLPEQETHSAFASFSQHFGERVEVLLDALYSTRDMQFLVPLSGVVVSVPSTNPFYVNPFGGTGPVRVEYDFSRELGPGTNDGNTETMAIHLAPVIDIGNAWRLAMSGAYGEETSDWHRTNRLLSASGPEFAAALRDDDPATALNVFGDGSANNPATLATLRRADDFDIGKNTAWSVEAIADGPLFDLSAGSAKLAAGVAYREDKLDVVSNFSAGSSGGTTDSRTNFAVFGELALPLMRRLEVSLAGRYDEYNDFGSAFNPKIGLAWSVVDSLRLRGNWGTSFRAPPFYLSSTDVNRPQVRTLNLNDPAGGGQTLTALVTGVVRDLEEETADVWTAGLDFTPMEGLRGSVTYFDIAYQGKIESPFSSTTAALVNENQYVGSGLIIRNPTQAQIDAVCGNPAEFAGTCSGTVLAIVDGRRRNVAITNVQGVDFDVSYSFDVPVGNLRAGIDGTYMLSYEKAVTNVSPLDDVLDTLENPLALRLRGTALWSRGRWSANAAVNYSGSYENDDKMPAERIGSWTTVDLGFGYKVERTSGSFWNGIGLRLTATNLFDEPPPFVDAVAGFGYDAANASLLGRTVSLQAVKEW